MPPSPRPAPPVHRQRLDIQGLRAIAVLAVIADHVLHWPNGGFVGVDVFFVISGFLITGLLLREVERTGRISFGRFYERRAKRILPAAVIVLAATVVSSFVLLGRDEAKSVGVDAIFSAVFLGNWRFAQQGVDYFEQGTPPSPLQHFWSLGVEEQFYLVWPWVMLLIVVLVARRVSAGAGAATDGAGSGEAAFLRAKRLARLAIVLLTAASFAWALYETTANPAVAYFSTFSRAWELGIGAFLAFLPRIAFSPIVRRVLVWVGLVGIACSLVVVSGDSPLWPAPLALLPVVSTALVILSGTGDLAAYREPWILRNRVAHYVGDISYSLYLWHFPIAILLLTLLPVGTGPYVVIALGATFILSSASYHLVENPARRATWFQWSGRRIRGLTRAWLPTTAAVAVIAVVGVAGFAAVSQLRPDPAVAGPDAQTVSPADPSAEPADVDCWGAGSALRPDACAGVDLGALAPAPETLTDDTDGAYDCYATTDGPLQTCALGAENAPTRVALVGDSHAAALIPALRPQLDALGWRLDTFVGRGCVLMEVPDQDTDCDTARSEVNELLTSGEYDIVITTSTRQWEMPIESQRSILERIRDAGTIPVVVRDNPLPTEESIACTTRLGASADSGCGTEADVALANTHTLADAADELGTPVVDFTDLYCSDGFCPGIMGNVLVYRDAAGHITATWATTLSAPLARALLEATGTP
ncbi:acyltransferase family protein [Microbacterium sp. G2-8]|uniref:acyltransferase family protein n=1 Tax=Microbacterium sp. G2-8 TaxID=2842454 RepID=UPI001C8938BD|nr:acyltransferase family protein [Microbacterium sp. G2-8]